MQIRTDRPKKEPIVLLCRGNFYFSNHTSSWVGNSEKMFWRKLPRTQSKALVRITSVLIARFGLSVFNSKDNGITSHFRIGLCIFLNGL